MDDPARTILDGWRAYWTGPCHETARPLITDDFVGYWPGEPEPIRGADANIAYDLAFFERLPGLRYEPTAHAVEGDVGFIAWRADTHVGGRPATFHGAFRLLLAPDARAREGLFIYDRMALHAAHLRAAGRMRGTG